MKIDFRYWLVVNYKQPRMTSSRKVIEFQFDTAFCFAGGEIYSNVPDRFEFKYHQVFHGALFQDVFFQDPNTVTHGTPIKFSGLRFKHET